MNARIMISLGLVLMWFTGAVQAQTDNNLIVGDNTFWTVPSNECDSPNRFCEVRISTKGNIYGWDATNYRLYMSPINTEHYDVYDLSAYSEYLIFVTDFIPIDNEKFVVFFSPSGASQALTRYDLVSQTIEVMDFPVEYELLGCNRYTSTQQTTLRQIFQLGTDQYIIACTNSPQDRPVIQIINVQTLTITDTIDINGQFFDIIQPNWIISGGWDNKIYALVNNPETIIDNLPSIDNSVEEIVLIFDVMSDSWSYKVKPLENTLEIAGVLPNSGGSIFINHAANDKELIHFSPNFRILHRIPIGNLVFQGLNQNGDFFLSTGDDYSDVRIINIDDYPLLASPPVSRAG
ncbi:hypothetical protein G4Y79_20485 [Phototrophicus methaneseepsis]|uniref:Uncharacterized protein n=1 Tax=Phototrophicus methaneseepsis TaxID=2710758 RepID=A0A7S8E7Z4_9CHLR|nr:hypothetical protein [Phototrophicus methaneseepsis]QPC82041.1 hypothetical protein G4Y79_20485 [Phototrophicus methaneseepsis]